MPKSILNEFTIGLDVKSNRPLYEQTYQFLKAEIQEGRLSAGERIPSTKSFDSAGKSKHGRYGL